MRKASSDAAIAKSEEDSPSAGERDTGGSAKLPAGGEADTKVSGNSPAGAAAAAGRGAGTNPNTLQEERIHYEPTDKMGTVHEMESVEGYGGIMKLQKANPHKFGANCHDPARPQKVRDPNFAQTRDVREDRGERQIKFAKRPR